MPKVMTKKTRPRISLDTETTGKDLRHGCQPFFVTSCNEAGEISYWEWDVNPLTRKPIIPESDLAEIRLKLCFGVDTVFQNPKFDFHALETIQITPSWDRVWDTLLAGHLLASNQPHDLTTMALIYLGINIKPYEDALKEACNAARRLARSKYPSWRIAKEGLPEIPSCKPESSDKAEDGTPRSTPWANDMWLPRAIAKQEKYPEDHPWWTVLRDYSNADSEVTLKLFAVMEEELKLRGLWEIYLERLKVLPVAYKIERRGVTTSRTRLMELREKYTVGSKESEAICLNIASSYDYKLEFPKAGLNNSLRGFVLHQEEMEEQPGLGLISPKVTATGNPSMDKFVIEEWVGSYPDWDGSLSKKSKAHLFIKNLSMKRSQDTANGYMKSYEKFWVGDSEDWATMFPSLNPTGTDTLRWTSQGPNEQQISKKEGYNLRYCFGPGPEREWWSCDAQNIERRIPAYEAGEEAIIELLEQPDKPPYYGSEHAMVAHLLFSKEFEACGDGKAFKKKYAATRYQWTKNGNFAIQYGCQKAKADATYHVDGAFELLKQRFHKQEALNQYWIDFANKHGYVETMPDKSINATRGYPLLCSRSKYGKVLPTVPLNYHIQGTACWWMCRAMVRVQEFFDDLNKKNPKKQYYMVMQVHDELVFDFPKGTGTEPWKTNYAIIQEVKRLMAMGGQDIGIPTPVSCEYHEHNWSEGRSV